MKNTSKLAIARETIRNLQPFDLHGVAGGGGSGTSLPTEAKGSVGTGCDADITGITNGTPTTTAGTIRASVTITQ